MLSSLRCCFFSYTYPRKPATMRQIHACRMSDPIKTSFPRFCCVAKKGFPRFCGSQPLVDAPDSSAVHNRRRGLEAMPCKRIYKGWVTSAQKVEDERHDDFCHSFPFLKHLPVFAVLPLPRQYSTIESFEVARV